MFSIILLYTLFSASLIAGKLCFAYITPCFLVALRTLLAGILMCSYIFLFRKDLFKNSFRVFLPYLYPAFFIYYFPTTLRYWALQYVQAAKVSFFFNFEPFVAAFFSYLILKKSLTKRQWFALLIGFFAMLVFMTSSTSLETTLGGFLYISWAEIALVIGILSSGFGIVMLKYSMHKHSIHPLVMNGYATLLSSTFALATAWILEPVWTKAPLQDIFLPSFGYVMFMVFASNIFNRTLYAHLIKQYSATFMAYAAFLGPIIAAILGWFILGEKIWWQFFVCGGIVFFGIYLFYRDERK